MLVIVYQVSFPGFQVSFPYLIPPFPGSQVLVIPYFIPPFAGSQVLVIPYLYPRSQVPTGHTSHPIPTFSAFIPYFIPPFPGSQVHQFPDSLSRARAIMLFNTAAIYCMTHEMDKARKALQEVSHCINDEKALNTPFCLPHRP